MLHSGASKSAHIRITYTAGDEERGDMIEQQRPEAKSQLRQRARGELKTVSDLHLQVHHGLKPNASNA